MSRPLRCLLACLLAATPAAANPTGGRVVAGQAEIGASVDGRLVIDQTSERAILEWGDFSIEVEEHTHFSQPGASAIVLNRVVGGEVSRIFGVLTADGQVVLVNPSGVHFGPESRVDVAGLIATTADLDDADFMVGDYRFDEPGDADGFVLNEGTITVAEGGLVALVAPWVENRGVIEAKLGRVALAAGETFVLDLYGDQLLQLEVSEDQLDELTAPAEGEDPEQGVTNVGLVAADGGRVLLMTAPQARRALDRVVNVDGIVQARTVAERNGRIELLGGEHVRVAGTLDVSGSESGEGGGEVEIRGVRVEVAPGAEIRAQAGVEGDGGDVRLWSDVSTEFFGVASVRGGSEGGDGGVVEISGAESVVHRGAVDVSAPAGSGGTLYIDPPEVVVGYGRSATLTPTQVRNVLLMGGRAVIEADETVRVEATIDGRPQRGRTGTPNGSVEIRAGEDVFLEADILTFEGAVDVHAEAGDIAMAEVARRDRRSVLIAATDGVRGIGEAPISLTAGGSIEAQHLVTRGRVELESTGGAGTVRLEQPLGYGEAPLESLSIVTAGADVEIANDVVTSDGGRGVTIRSGGTLTMDPALVVPMDPDPERSGAGLFVVGEDPMGGLVPGEAPLSLRAAGDLDAGHLVTRGSVDLTSDDGNLTLRDALGSEAAPVAEATIGATRGDVNLLADIVSEGPVRVVAGRDLAMDDALAVPIAGGGVRTGALVVVTGAAPPAGAPAIELAAGRDLDVSHLRTPGAVKLSGDGRVVLHRALGSVAAPVGGAEIEGGDVEILSDVVSRNEAVDVRAATGDVVMAPDTVIAVAGGNAGAFGAGPGPITVIAEGSVAAGRLVTDGAVTVETTQGDVRVDDAVVTGGAPVRIEAGRDVVMQGGAGVFLGETFVGPKAGVLEIEAGRDASLESLVAHTSITVDGERDVTVGRSLGTTDAPVGAVSLAGGGVDLQGGIVTDAAPIDVTARERSILMAPDVTLQVSDGSGSVGSAGIMLDSEGDLETQHLSTRGVVELASRTSVRLGRPLGSVSPGGDVPVGGLAVTAPDVDVASPVVAAGDVALGQPGGDVLLRENVFTGGGDLDFLGNVRLDPRGVPGPDDRSSAGLPSLTTWGLTLDSSSPGGGGDVTFRGGLDASDAFRDEVEVQGPPGQTVSGVFDFAELVLDAGDGAIRFEGNVGSAPATPRAAPSTDCTTSACNSLRLQVARAGSLSVAPGASLHVNAISVPAALVEFDTDAAGDPVASDVADPPQLRFEAIGDRLEVEHPAIVGGDFSGTGPGLYQTAGGGVGVGTGRGTAIGAVLPNQESVDADGASTPTPPAAGVGVPRAAQPAPATGPAPTPDAPIGPRALAAPETSDQEPARPSDELIVLPPPPEVTVTAVPPTAEPPGGGVNAPRFALLGPRPSEQTQEQEQPETVAMAEEESEEGEEGQDDDERPLVDRCQDLDEVAVFQTTPGAAAFGQDPRSNAFSVDAYCGDYDIVEVDGLDRREYRKLTFPTRDYWTDAAQARTPSPLPELAPEFGIAPAVAAPGPEE